MSAPAPVLYSAPLYGSSLFDNNLVGVSLSLTMADSAVSSAGLGNAVARSLADFLIIKEWVAIQIQRNPAWLNIGANENLFDTLFGKYKYGGVALYSGIMPGASWVKTDPRTEAWTQPDGHKNNY